MQSKLDILSVAYQNRNKLSTGSLWIYLVVLYLVLASLCEGVAAVWSIPAMERLKAQKSSESSSAQEIEAEFRYKVAVFYGTWQQRQQMRACEKLKCEFISTGCVVSDEDPPPPFLCYTIWSELSSTRVGDCPYKPCEGYNQGLKCLPDDNNCTQSQGELIPFGLCKDNKRCCMLPNNP